MRRTSFRPLRVEWAALLALAPGLSGCGGAADKDTGAPGSPGAPAITNSLKGPDDKGHTLYVNGIAYSPDGKSIATTGHDHTAKLWDAGTGKVLATFNGHGAVVKGVAILAPTARRVYTAHGRCDQAAYCGKLWDVATGK